MTRAEHPPRFAPDGAPVSFLVDFDGTVTTLDVGERLARDLPNARLITYPHCGHFPMLEAAIHGALRNGNG